jgi:carboxymethylenebutenolidase
VFTVAALVFSVPLETTAMGQSIDGPETVEVHNGPVTLHALVFRPRGRGPFPAILLNHGSGRTAAELKQLGPYERNAGKLGPLLVRHGYVFLYLFRRGVGLSTDQGVSSVDLMNSKVAAHGQEARNALQLRLLEDREMSDALSGLKFLRALPYVGAHDVGVVGHSFGGSLTVLMAERDPDLRAVVVFSAAGYSFDRSPELRQRLLTAVDHIAAPVFFIHAQNDYSLSSGKILDARRKQLGKQHRLKIYPPIGKTVEEGHEFLHLGMSIWEPDVFRILRRAHAEVSRMRTVRTGSEGS